MAMHVEFEVPGPPFSNQQSTTKGRTNLSTWQATVAGAAGPLWGNPLLLGRLKGTIINFYDTPRPSLDVDNKSKPIFDVLEGIVYKNDRQVVQAELTHLEVGALYVISGASKILVTALQAGSPFVYVRIDDAVDPFPLPR